MPLAPHAITRGPHACRVPGCEALATEPKPTSEPSRLEQWFPLWKLWQLPSRWRVVRGNPTAARYYCEHHERRATERLEAAHAMLAASNAAHRMRQAQLILQTAEALDFELARSDADSTKALRKRFQQVTSAEGSPLLPERRQ